MGFVVKEAEAQSKWQPSFSFYEQYTDNIDLTAEETVGAWKTVVNPAVTYLLPSLRRTVRVDMNLKLDYRLRDDGYEDTLYWLGVWVYLGRQYSPRTSYEISSSYDITYTSEDVNTPYVDVVDDLTRADVFALRPSISHKLGKNTDLKFGLSYEMVTYNDPNNPSADEIGGSVYLEQKIGPRITIGTGLSYAVRTVDNDTGFTEYEIPLGIKLDLTHIQLKLGGSYLYRDYDSGFSQINEEGNEDQYSSEGNFLFGFSLELGGQILRLRATMLELKFINSFHDDLFGRPYQNQELKLALYHAYKKFDFYTDLRYGINTYVQSDDKHTYWGPNVSLKWRLTEKQSIDFTLAYTDYEFERSSDTSAHQVINGVIDYNHNIYYWLYTGLSYGHRESSSNEDVGNYSENLYGWFLRANW